MILNEIDSIPTGWYGTLMNSENEEQASPHSSKIKFLDATLRVVRRKGYHSTRIEDVCAEAGLTKGSFFHHFKTKEELAIAAAEHWSNTTGLFFEQAPYREHADPLDRVLGYIDFRIAILRGELSDFTCYAGTTVQEIYGTNPLIREACYASISGHAAEVAEDIEEARHLYAPNAPWSAESLALHTQAVIQGAFILAKAKNDHSIAADSILHLRRYVELLFSKPRPKE
jgi:TetR/AcrR family transcriptional repressor of nem operon